MISQRIRVCWGTGALGVALLMNAIGVLALFYMVSVLGIEPGLAGTLVFLTKLLDVVSDPIVGSWSDRIKSPAGRRRPFLLAGAFVSACAFALIFTTPVFETQWLTAAYVFLALSTYTVGYTLFNVPYMAMPAEMTDSYHERSAIHGYRMVFIATGVFLATSISPLILDRLGRENWNAYAVIGAGGGAVILISMLTTYFGTARARFTDAGVERINVFRQFSPILANPHFLRLIAVKAAQLLGIAASQATIVFFVVHYLRLPLTVLFFYGVVVTIVSTLGTPLLVALSKRIGKRETYLLAAFCYLAGVSSWMLAGPGEPLPYILARGAIIAIAASGNIVMAMSMLTDTIEYDARRTGVRREGVYTAVYSFVEKFTFAMGPLIVGWAMQIAGFDRSLSDEALQTPEVGRALLLGMSYMPTFVGCAAILLLTRYRLTDKDLMKLRTASS